MSMPGFRGTVSSARIDSSRHGLIHTKRSSPTVSKSGYSLDRGGLANIDLKGSFACGSQKSGNYFSRVNRFYKLRAGKDIDQLLRASNSEFALSCAGIAPSSGQEWSTAGRGTEAGSPPVPVHCACSGFAEEGIHRSGVA